MNPVIAPVHDLVRTRSGEVRGSVADGVISFKGIPYAAPPFGANHLRPPQPVESWSGVREAFEFGPKSPQVRYPANIDQYMPELTGPGEDCLRLNIWTPEAGATGLPVMVWIPGGMYEFHATGASPWYDGTRFAQDGVVLVTINYRVGAEGFLYLHDGIANIGLQDQIAALEWVHENIGAFGGDPDNVTIFGESAGALSVGTLLSMPRAKGLFRRAILQSGAAHHVTSAASGLKIAQCLAQNLGVAPTREAIAAAPVERLLAAQMALRDDLMAHADPQRWGADVVTSMLPWAPVVDGEIVPARPIDRIAAGAAADIDLIVGTNVDENRLFLVVSGEMERITDQMVAGVAALYGLPVEAALAFYRARSCDYGNGSSNATAGDLLAAIQTDWYWRIPAIRLADAHAKNATKAATFMYEFAWCSPQLNGLLGACHGSEIPFVFDTLGHGTDMQWGDQPPQKLADAMHSAWVRFAATGDCGWPKYDLSRRATIHFDTCSTVVDDPRAAERRLWEGVR